MTRTAQCVCGALSAEAEGEPISVVACSCLDCQRRTGSVLGVGAYYPETQVRITGPSKEYARRADSGQPFTAHFCMTCGTGLSSASTPRGFSVAATATERDSSKQRRGPTGQQAQS